MSVGPSPKILVWDKRTILKYWVPFCSVKDAEEKKMFYDIDPGQS